MEKIMPSPVYVAGTPGNLVAGLSVAPGVTAAVFLDVSTDVEAFVTCELITGATAPTAATSFEATGAYAAGAAAPMTLSGPAAAGTASLPLNSSPNLAGLHAGQKAAVLAADGVGEVVTLSAAPTGTGAQSVACSTLVGSYAASSGVYFMTRSSTTAVSPSDSATQGWAANNDYSSRLSLGASQYIINIANADATATVTVALTLDRITAIQ
ncbi:MAG: hypothetical protein ACYC61_17835 [Isosphaeraceae bacterium]